MDSRASAGASLRLGLLTWRWLRRRWKWGSTGVLLVVLHLAIARLSNSFGYEETLISKPILGFVALQLLAGGVYLAAAWHLRALSAGRTLLFWIFVVGAALRAATFFSTPILEDDFYRYLWDGAVLANGLNPYAFAPNEARLVPDDAKEATLRSLSVLASNSGEVLSRVNHADLRTIYPPVAQAAFALGHWIYPWNLLGWRLVLLGCDLATLALLVVILRTLDLPLLSLAIYWWNPLLVKEVYNSGHMDIIALPFVLGAILFSLRGKHLWGVFLLGFAGGAKIWPVLLLPVFLRSIAKDRKTLFFSFVLLGVVGAAVAFPILSAGLSHRSGFLAYSRTWEMNDALFMALLWGAEQLAGQANAQVLARLAAACLLLGWIAWSVRKESSVTELCQRCLWIVAVALLLSPVQFPWYYLWLLPLLAVCPSGSLLWLGALLPLYYLRFYFAARHSVAIFDYGIVWLEYLPVWFLLAREWYIRKVGTDTEIACRANSVSVPTFPRENRT